MSSEPLSQRVWQVMSDSPKYPLSPRAIARTIGEDRIRVRCCLHYMVKKGTARRTANSRYIRGDEARPQGSPKSRALTCTQRSALELCTRAGGAFVKDVATAAGITGGEASTLLECLVRRTAIEREAVRGVSSGRYRITGWGWELLSNAEVAHAAE